MVNFCGAKTGPAAASSAFASNLDRLASEYSDCFFRAKEYVFFRKQASAGDQGLVFGRIIYYGN